MATVAARALPTSFKLGTKQVFLPSHVITFLRTPELPPAFASFQVPLTFTKFDLRDYLWNVYGVETTKVRSHVKPGRFYQDGNQTLRARSTKVMIVELVEPFQWPDLPADKSPWKPELSAARRNAMQTQQRDRELSVRGKPITRTEGLQPTVEDKLIRREAINLRSGQTQWSNKVVLDPKWNNEASAKSLDTVD